jgi:hypothetical protein
MEPRQLLICTRLVNPGFPGEPVVIGLADRAVGAREEYRTASKAFAIRFDAGRDRASRLRAFDHEYSHLHLPCFSLAFSFRSRALGRRSVGLHLPSRGELTPTDPTASLVHLIQVTFWRTLATLFLIGSAVSIAAL